MTDGINYYLVDVESNGVNSAIHEINEISIIRVKDKVQLTEFIKCDHPEHSNFDALAITGKTLADLANGLSKKEAAEKIDNFLYEDGSVPGGRCFIAHNAAFDRRFLHAMYEKIDRVFPADYWICSMAMTREYAKKVLGIQKPKVNLAAACDLLEIKKIAHAHSSKMDSRNTFLLWKKLVEEKQMDYLPFIKNAAHSLKSNENDADLLDLNDVL